MIFDIVYKNEFDWQDILTGQGMNNLNHGRHLLPAQTLVQNSQDSSEFNMI